ncbi:MAG: efflux RND transporter periplasmic adaptor subunit [Pseudomarimonas sp.]
MTRRRVDSLFMVAACTALLALTLQLTGCGSAHDEAPPARPAMVVQPRPTAADFVVFPGEVRAQYEPALAFRIGGKITRRLVDVGDQVKQGDLLAELDPEDVRLQVQSAQAQLTAAQADMDLARNELDRHRALLERKLISTSLFETRETQFRAAQARAAQIKAQLDVAQNQAGYAQLRASDTGVVAQRLAETGQVVAAGQTVFVLAAEGDREVAINLPEQTISQFKVGQQVAVGLWSKPDQQLVGTIRELAPSADPLARTYAARIALTGSDEGVDLGQSARVFFASANAAALSLPLPAVSADGGRSFVWVVDPRKLTVARREVTIGAFGDDSVPVLSGLEANEWVVAAGSHLLSEGQSVRPVDRENRVVNMTPAS